MQQTPGKYDQHRERTGKKDQEKFAVAHELVVRCMSGYRLGVIAMLLAIVVSSWLSLAMRWPSPFEAPGETVVEWTPLPIATLLLLNLHGLAPALALLGSVAVLLLMGGVAGSVSRLGASGYPAALISGCLLTLLIWWVLLPYDWRPQLAVVVVYVAVSILLASGRTSRLGHLRGLHGRYRDIESRNTGLMSRRQVLFDTGLVLGGIGLAGLAPLTAPYVEAQPSRRLFTLIQPHIGNGFAIDGLTPFVTPTPDFYLNSKDILSPRPTDSSLELVGLVRQSLHLSRQQIQSLPRVDHYAIMECVDNPVGGRLIGNALWSGVLIRDILEMARPLPGASALVFQADDGYVESVPLSWGLDHGLLVVYGMNGQTLTADHGFPLRILAPGLYGFKSVKWLRRITLASKVVSGLWQEHGWTREAAVRTGTRIDVCRPADDGVLVAGIAFAGIRGISRVQIRVGGEGWQDATLSRSVVPGSWRLWRITIPAQGRVVIEARAVDGNGVIQTRVPRGAYPSGATGYASRSLVV